MPAASFGSTYSDGIGHWSNWGPWTSCNQACLPPVSVTAVMNHVVPVTPYSAPLYLHGGVQTRRRTCLFTPVYGCPGGPTQANESRPCPPVPACHTDWSCWSDWSTCQPRPIDKGGSPIYSKVSGTESGLCEWKVDGIRKRVRQCVLGQGDWLANRPPSCSGPMDETESCPRLAGQRTSICPPGKRNFALSRFSRQSYPKVSGILLLDKVNRSRSYLSVLHISFFLDCNPCQQRFAEDFVLLQL